MSAEFVELAEFWPKDSRQNVKTAENEMNLQMCTITTTAARAAECANLPICCSASFAAISTNCCHSFCMCLAHGPNWAVGLSEGSAYSPPRQLQPPPLCPSSAFSRREPVTVGAES